MSQSQFAPIHPSSYLLYCSFLSADLQSVSTFPCRQIRSARSINTCACLVEAAIVVEFVLVAIANAPERMVYAAPDEVNHGAECVFGSRKEANMLCDGHLMGIAESKVKIYQEFCQPEINAQAHGKNSSRASHRCYSLRFLGAL